MGKRIGRDDEGSYGGKRKMGFAAEVEDRVKPSLV